jgi:subtilisin family serine protease
MQIYQAQGSAHAAADPLFAAQPAATLWHLAALHRIATGEGITVADESMASIPADVYGAPGRGVPTTLPGGKWSLVDGSSYAAAHVSGLIALVREKMAFEPRALLVANRASGGALDACATLSGAAKFCPCDCALADKAVAAGS